jgi:hypothetical protein
VGPPQLVRLDLLNRAWSAWSFSAIEVGIPRSLRTVTSEVRRAQRARSCQALARRLSPYGLAPERRAQPEVGWQRGGERADAQAASAVDFDVAPDQHRVGPPRAATNGPSPVESGTYADERWASRRVVGRRLTSPATAQQNARPVQSNTSASPARSSAWARPLTRTTGGWADCVLPMNSTSTGRSSPSLPGRPTC